MTVIEKREIQEDGHYQVSCYDSGSQKLTHRWLENEGGKKDGMEVEYAANGSPAHLVNWKNGEKDGIEINFRNGNRYNDEDINTIMHDVEKIHYINFTFVTNWKQNKKHGEEIEQDFNGKIISEKVYDDGKCIKDIRHIYKRTAEVEALLETVHAPHLGLAEHFYATKDCINNEILYIKAEKPSRHYLHEYTGVFYEMKFLHGKEWYGEFRFHEIYNKDHYTIVGGKLDGSYLIGDKESRYYKEGHYYAGKFSGVEKTVETDTPLGSYIKDIKSYTNQWTIEDKGLQEVLKKYSDDELVGYKVKTSKGVYDIPLNGHAHIENYDAEIDCDIKDGKLDGLYKSKGEKSLAGSCSFEKECNFKNGVLDGNYKEIKESIKYHPNSGVATKEITNIQCCYQDGKLEGVYKEVKESEEYPRYKFINTYTYKNGELDGIYINEEEKVSANYKNGKVDGKYTKFYDKINGVKEVEREYKNGKLNGVSCEYNERGNKVKESTYKDDVLDGQYIEYFTNGKKKCEGNYSNGNKNGFWKIYADNGDLIETRRFDNGKDVTKKYEKLKKIAAKHIEAEKKEEQKIFDKTGKKVRVTHNNHSLKGKFQKMIDKVTHDL